jgi:hypothetical protein
MVDKKVEDVARRVAGAIWERMPEAITHLLQNANSGHVAGLRLECNLVLDNASSPSIDPPRQVISIDVAPLLQQLAGARETPIPLAPPSFDRAALPPLEAVGTPSSAVIETRNFRPRSTLISPAPTPEEFDDHPSKMRKATGGLRVRVDANAEPISGPTTNTARRLESDGRVFPQRKKNVGDNPVFQPSSLQKFVKGVWESIFSSIRMDPTEVIEQWQAIESNGQPKLLTSWRSSCRRDGCSCSTTVCIN